MLYGDVTGPPIPECIYPDCHTHLCLAPIGATKSICAAGVYAVLEFKGWGGPPDSRVPQPVNPYLCFRQIYCSMHTEWPVLCHEEFELSAKVYTLRRALMCNVCTVPIVLKKHKLQWNRYNWELCNDWSRANCV